MHYNAKATHKLGFIFRLRFGFSCVLNTVHIVWATNNSRFVHKILGRKAAPFSDFVGSWNKVNEDIFSIFFEFYDPKKVIKFEKGSKVTHLRSLLSLQSKNGPVTELNWPQTQSINATSHLMGDPRKRQKIENDENIFTLSLALWSQGQKLLCLFLLTLAMCFWFSFLWTTN